MTRDAHLPAILSETARQAPRISRCTVTVSSSSFGGGDCEKKIETARLRERRFMRRDVCAARTSD